MKTITYGLMHLTVAITVGYALTRNWQAALAIGLIEPVIQTFAYIIHERLWAKVPERRKREQPAGRSRDFMSA